MKFTELIFVVLIFAALFVFQQLTMEIPHPVEPSAPSIVVISAEGKITAEGDNGTPSEPVTEIAVAPPTPTVRAEPHSVEEFELDTEEARKSYQLMNQADFEYIPFERPQKRNFALKPKR